MMKISTLLFAAFILQAVASSEIVERGKPPAPIPRPSSFASDVNGVLSDMANANKYTRFDRCHVIPWQFLRDMIVKYNSKKITKAVMQKFVDDLAQIHKSAAFYTVLKSTTRKTLSTLTTKYHTNAINALSSGNTKELVKNLYNMPSNLYPGDPGNNRSIQDNFDTQRRLGHWWEVDHGKCCCEKFVQDIQCLRIDQAQ